ncbi:MAG TPA: hypothetical protein VMU81_27225 [Acetobacteraceae bacterium]|jgi:hypothetical protein|nr:hypothetical protein [Acetobacteraceae bacterium]
MDAIYRVSFYKKLTDDTGHPAEPCQGVVEVHEKNRKCAIEVAKQRFAELKGATDSSAFADYAIAKAVPSALSRS